VPPLARRRWWPARRRSAACFDERPVGEHVIDQPEHRRRRHPQREADGTTPVNDVGIDDQLFGERVADVVDAGDVGVAEHPTLGQQIVLEGPMPVDVVGRDVEAGRGDRGQRALPIQLEAGQFDREHVIGLRM
jgi:hypothetical protein